MCIARCSETPVSYSKASVADQVTGDDKYGGQVRVLDTIYFTPIKQAYIGVYRPLF